MAVSEIESGSPRSAWAPATCFPRPTGSRSVRDATTGGVAESARSDGAG